MRVSPRNYLRTGTVTATSEATGYPATYAADGDTTRPWVAIAGAADVALRGDLDLGQGAGEFEAWSGGVPVDGDGNAVGVDLSDGPGSIAEEGSIVHGGSKALKLLAGSGGVGRFKLYFPVRAGETVHVGAWLRGDGTGVARLRVRDPITDKWWDPTANGGAGGWTATETDAATQTTTTWTEKSVPSIVLADFAAHQVDAFNLEVHLLCNTSGQVGYADDVACWPSWDLVVLHGHNITPGLGIELRANDADSWADESAFQEDAFQSDAFQQEQGSGDLVASVDVSAGDAPPRRPACYLLLDEVRAERYLEIKFPGTHPTQLYVGEAHVGISEETDPSFRPTHSARAALPQVVVQTPAGRRHVSSYTTDPVRGLTLSFMARTFDEARELQQSLLWATRQGTELLAVVPIEDGPEVYLARVVEPLEESVQLLRSSHAHNFSVALAEDGFPTVG